MLPKLFCDPHSLFMTTQVPRFLERFSLSCYQEDLCSEYYIESLPTGQTVSSALVLAQNVFANKVHVSRFYPKLFKLSGTKYMSAVAFYLMIHHFSQTRRLNAQTRISLDTTNAVFEQFYSRLQDFHFVICQQMVGSNVALLSDYSHDEVDVDMIGPHALGPEEQAFWYP